MCPYAHAGEKARRRDPMCGEAEPLYTGIACPSMKSVSFRFVLERQESTFLELCCGVARVVNAPWLRSMRMGPRARELCAREQKLLTCPTGGERCLDAQEKMVEDDGNKMYHYRGSGPNAL